MTFLPNERYLHDGMFANESAALETLHNWIELSAGESPLSYSELPAWGGVGFGLMKGQMGGDMSRSRMRASMGWGRGMR